MNLHDVLTSPELGHRSEGFHELIEYYVLQADELDLSGIIDHEIEHRLKSAGGELLKQLIEEYQSTQSEYEDLESKKQAWREQEKQLHIDDAIGDL